MANDENCEAPTALPWRKDTDRHRASKTSRLLQLPLEIREMVWRDYLDDHQRQYRVKVTAPLLRVSSGIRREVLPLWCSIVLNYRASKSASQVLERCTSAEFIRINQTKEGAPARLEAVVLLCRDSSDATIAFNTMPRIKFRSPIADDVVFEIGQVSARLTLDSLDWHQARTRIKIDWHSKVALHLVACALDAFIATKECLTCRGRDQGFSWDLINSLLFRIYDFYLQFCDPGNGTFRIPTSPPGSSQN